MDVPQYIAGRFRIEGKIGAGGMGTVYRAIHLGLERPVAVKIIKAEFATDRDVADRFLREARTMAKLRHPHAAMIFDAGHLPDGRHFIIMEFVEGITLSEALARDGCFSPDRAVKIAVQICEVLEEAHQIGIIHRDLKPSNIMLNERGVCVLDFGVAKVLASSTEVTATHATTGSGQIVGTPRYMSPEQCLGQRVGARSDLYSLGVLLYEMLAGRPPFIDPLPSAVLVKQATVPPPPLPHLRPDVSRPVALAIHNLLAKRPEDRPRTAAAARALLERSVLESDRFIPELEPLSSTVAAVGASSSSILFRIGAPLTLVAILGAMLLVLANNGETATQPIPQNIPAISSMGPMTQSQVAPRSLINRKGPEPGNLDAAARTSRLAASENRLRPIPIVSSSESISTERAQKIINSVSHGLISDVQVVQTPSGSTLVAIHDKRSAGTSHFFVIESRRSGFNISTRGMLDTPHFRHATWTAEKIDADGDGYEEVLFTGTDPSAAEPGYRLVLYVPRTRTTYSLRLEGNGRIGRPLRAVWSRNSLGKTGAPFRSALRESVNTAIIRARHR